MKTEIMSILIIYFTWYLKLGTLHICKLQNWNMRAIHVTDDMAHGSMTLAFGDINFADDIIYTPQTCLYSSISYI